MDCLALGPDRFLLRLRARRGTCLRVFLVYHLNKYEWLSGRSRREMAPVLRDSEFDYYECEIRGRDNRLAYIFEIGAEDGLWYYSEEGISREFCHEQAYFCFFQYCFVHACDIFSPPAWTETACVYQIFPERFRNGTGKKAYVDTPWDAPPAPKSFYGGDLAGIKEKLDYLSDLGVSCLYLTPVCSSPSNHKYDIVDYWDVDSAFGGREALRSLVAAAHARGIRVLLDGVFNHCSSQNALFLDVKRNGRNSRYHDWFFIDGDFPDEEKGNYSMFASVKYMPRLNTGNQEVIDYFCRNGAWWIREFDTDGWRLDVCDEISDRFLRAFRDSVKREKPDAVILGEIWHDPSHWLAGDMLDGVMDYTLTKACLDYLAFGTLDAEGFCDRLVRCLWRVPPPAAAMFLNLVGSHDTDRFLTRVGEDRELLKMGYAAAFFFPGMPCVYYGDEVGLTGGYDPGCRRGFPWEADRQDGDIRSFIRRLYALKKQPALSRGRFKCRAENGMAVLERTDPEQTALLYMNPTGRDRETAAGVRVPAGRCLAVLCGGEDGTEKIVAGAVPGGKEG